MTRKHLSQVGKLLFLVAFGFMAVGAAGIWGFALFSQQPFLIPGIALGLFLLSFTIMALGSRVGDQQ